jgi:hypothetical protein
MTSLPHDPYIAALAIADMDPDDAWTSDAETDPYGDGCTTMLSAVLRWNGHHQAVNTDAFPDGMLLFWEHPAEQWQYAEVLPGGSNTVPEFLAGVGRLADPAAVVTAVRELLAGRPAPTAEAALWGQAASAETAIASWAAAEGGEA